MATIHPSAIVDRQVELGSGVEIGPGCVLSGAVRLGDGVRVIAQAHLHGPLDVGSGTIIWPFAALGREPQDYKFRPGDPTAGVVVGRDCLIREHATVHAATRSDRPTRVGDGVFMMQNSHVGHDAQVGDRVILVNGALLAGHVIVGERANVGGNAAVHQHVRIGRLSMISGPVGLSRDLPPFCVTRLRNRMAGINVIGMRRAGMSSEEIRGTRDAFRNILRVSMPKDEMLARLDEMGERIRAVAEIAEFIRGCTRGICSGEHQPPPGFSAWMRAYQQGPMEEIEEEAD